MGDNQTFEFTIFTNSFSKLLENFKHFVGAKDTVQGSIRFHAENGRFELVGGTIEGLLVCKVAAVFTGTADLLIPFHTLAEWASLQSRNQPNTPIDFKVQVTNRKIKYKKGEYVPSASDPEAVEEAKEDGERIIAQVVLKASCGRSAATFNAAENKQVFLDTPQAGAVLYFISYSEVIGKAFKIAADLLPLTKASDKYRETMFIKTFKPGVYLFVTDGFFMYQYQLEGPGAMEMEFAFGGKMVHFPFTEGTIIQFHADKLHIFNSEMDYWQVATTMHVPDISPFLKRQGETKIVVPTASFKMAVRRAMLLSDSPVIIYDLETKTMNGLSGQTGVSVNLVPGEYTSTFPVFMFNAVYVQKIMAAANFGDNFTIYGSSPSGPFYLVGENIFWQFVLMPMHVDNYAEEPRILELKKELVNEFQVHNG